MSSFILSLNKKNDSFVFFQEGMEKDVKRRILYKIVGTSLRKRINNVQAQRQSYKPGHQTPSKNPYLTFTDTMARRPGWRGGTKCVSTDS